MTTIKEIAKLSGVSPMTVSNVINNKHTKVSKDTIEKVQKIIEELNYIPNMTARSLVSKNSNIIVLIIPQTLEDDPDKDYAMNNPFYGEFINSIEFHLRKNNCYMMLRFVSEDEEYHKYLRIWNADGVIVLGTDQKQYDLNLAQIDIPLVLVDSYVNEQQKHCTVVSDDKDGGSQAGEFLIQRKCMNLAVVSTDLSEKGVAQSRVSGFMEAVQRKGKDIPSKHIYQGFPSYEYGIHIAEELVKENIDGVFATTDMIAFGIIEGVKKLGKRVPEDISIVGFDGLFITELSHPKLTTIKQDIREKGQKAVELMLRTVQDQEYQEEVILAVSLLKKESVK